MKPRWALWTAAAVAYGTLETLWAVYRSPGLPLPLWFFVASLGLAGVLGALIGGLLEGLHRRLGKGTLPIVLAASGGVLVWKLSLVLPWLSAWPIILLFLPLLVPCLRLPDRDRLPAGIPLLLFALLASTDLVESFGRAAAQGSLGTSLWVGSWLLLVLAATRPKWKNVRSAPGRVPRGLLPLLLAGLVSLAAYGWWNTGRSIPWRWETDYTGPAPEVRLRSDRETGDLPNILLISIDALRWDMVPSRMEGLSHLNSLRRDSIEFTRMISTSSWTRPAHASLLTGRLPSEHRSTLYGRRRIDSDLATYTQYLRELGYHTAGFTGGGPLHQKHGFARGFDRYEHQVVKPYEGFVPGVIEALAWWLRDTRYRFVHEVGPPSPDETRRRAVFYPGEWRLRRFDTTLRRARQWIRGVRGSGRPWFLFLHTFEVHDYHHMYPENRRWLETHHPDLHHGLRELRRTWKQPPRGCLDLPSPGKFEAYLYRRLEEAPGALRDLYRRLLVMTSDRPGLRGRQYEQVTCVARSTRNHWRAFRHLYRRGIHSVDESVGGLLKFLREEELYEPTAIIFVSDHGEGFALETGAFVHGLGQLDELLIRVPAWIKLPGPDNDQVKRRQLLEITDLFPMLLDHFGLKLGGSHPFHSDQRKNPLTSRSEGGRPATRGSIRSFLGEHRHAFARGTRYKAVSTTRGDTPGFFRVGADTLSEVPIEPAEVPAGTRKTLEETLEDVIERIQEGGSPAEPETSKNQEPPLKGLGYF